MIRIIPLFPVSSLVIGIAVVTYNQSICCFRMTLNKQYHRLCSSHLLQLNGTVRDRQSPRRLRRQKGVIKHTHGGSPSSTIYRYFLLRLDRRAGTCRELSKRWLHWASFKLLLPCFDCYFTRHLVSNKRVVRLPSSSQLSMNLDVTLLREKKEQPPKTALAKRSHTCALFDYNKVVRTSTIVSQARR